MLFVVRSVKQDEGEGSRNHLPWSRTNSRTAFAQVFIARNRISGANIWLFVVRFPYTKYSDRTNSLHIGHHKQCQEYGLEDDITIQGLLDKYLNPAH